MRVGTETAHHHQTKFDTQSGRVVYAYNLNNWEAEAWELPGDRPLVLVSSPRADVVI